MVTHLPQVDGLRAVAILSVMLAHFHLPDVRRVLDFGIFGVSIFFCLLPGIQALFGFQLMVVFNSEFREHLTSAEQRLHLFTMVLAALAVALVMTPAPYHRQTRDDPKPEQFIALSSRLLLWSMFPLMAAIGLEVYVIARLILDSAALSLSVAIALLFVLSFVGFSCLIRNVFLD